MEGYTQAISYRHVFTTTEIEQMGRELAAEEITLKEIQGEFAGVKSEYKKKIGAKEDRIGELSGFIDTGEVFKELECEVEMNSPEEGKKTCTPVEGGKSFVVEMDDDDYNVLV